MANPRQKMTCPPVEAPAQGDVYVCVECGFTVVAAKPCACDDKDCVCLACCGQAMDKAN